MEPQSELRELNGVLFEMCVFHLLFNLSSKKRKERNKTIKKKFDMPANKLWAMDSEIMFMDLIFVE